MPCRLGYNFPKPRPQFSLVINHTLTSFHIIVYHRSIIIHHCWSRLLRWALSSFISQNPITALNFMVLVEGYGADWVQLPSILTPFLSSYKIRYSKIILYSSLEICRSFTLSPFIFYTNKSYFTSRKRIGRQFPRTNIYNGFFPSTSLWTGHIHDSAEVFSLGHNVHVTQCRPQQGNTVYVSLRLEIIYLLRYYLSIILYLVIKYY